MAGRESSRTFAMEVYRKIMGFNGGFSIASHGNDFQRVYQIMVDNYDVSLLMVDGGYNDVYIIIFNI